MKRTTKYKQTGIPPFSGVADIVRYNWSQYLAAIIVVLALGGFGTYAFSNSFPFLITVAAFMGFALALWWTVASLAASWWIYDLSPLRKWDWLHKLMPREGKKWVNVHTGLDECGYLFRHETGRGAGMILDTYDPQIMTEASIRRARRRMSQIHRPDALCRSSQWPVADDLFDICYFIFAAHELRKREERLTLFREAVRCLAAGGQIVVVEHARDILNFIAFGPGFTHFWPTKEWDCLASQVGLQCIHRGRIAGFVIVNIYGRKDA